MAVVNTTYVTEWLRAHGNLPPGTGLLICPAEDSGVDPEVAVSRKDACGESEEICSVQVGSGYLAVNSYGHTEPGNPASFFMLSHGMWGVQPADLEQVAATVRGLLTA